MSRACHWATPTAIGSGAGRFCLLAERASRMRLYRATSFVVIVDLATLGPPAQLGGICQMPTTGGFVGGPDGTRGTQPSGTSKTPNRMRRIRPMETPIAQVGQAFQPDSLAEPSG